MPKLILPAKFIFFLRKRRWELFQYQKEFIEAVNSSLYKSFLISSDTGTGKTITLFLPYLIKILNNEKVKIIYVSPLRSIISDLYDRLSEIKTDLNKVLLRPFCSNFKVNFEGLWPYWDYAYKYKSKNTNPTIEEDEV